jgi:hypothetical protein
MLSKYDAPDFSNVLRPQCPFERSGVAGPVDERGARSLGRGIGIGLSQPMRRSTTQRRGITSKVVLVSERRTTSTTKSRKVALSSNLRRS